MICSVLDMHFFLLNSFYGRYPVKTEHWRKARYGILTTITPFWVVLFTRKLEGLCKSLQSETDS